LDEGGADDLADADLFCALVGDIDDRPRRPRQL